MKVMRTTVATVVAATLSLSAFSVFAEASLTGAGATFPAPVYAKWADTYQKETGNKVNYQGIGSSGGVKQITANTVDFGASDAPLSDDKLNQEGLFQFPTVIGGVVLAINLPGVKSGELVLDGNPGSLRPLSTADLTHFYRSAAQNNEGITVLYANADNNNRVDQDALHGTVYLQCQNASCDVYFNRDELNLGSDAQALAAMRLGMRITSSAGTQTLIFRLDDMGATGGAKSARTIASAGSVVASIAGSGEPVYTSDPSQGIGGYMAQTNGNAYNPGSQKLMTLQAEEVATVEYWLYLEGCDDQCINPVQNRASQLRLAFAGVDNGSR